MDGMVIAPDVDFGTAGDEDDPPPTDALPFDTVYVHSMPFTVSVSVAAQRVAGRTSTARREAARGRRLVFMRNSLAQWAEGCVNWHKRQMSTNDRNANEKWGGSLGELAPPFGYFFSHTAKSLTVVPFLTRFLTDFLFL